jgi:hypothetical protein
MFMGNSLVGKVLMNNLNSELVPETSAEWNFSQLFLSPFETFKPTHTQMHVLKENPVPELPSLLYVPDRQLPLSLPH